MMELDQKALEAARLAAWSKRDGGNIDFDAAIAAPTARMEGSMSEPYFITGPAKIAFTTEQTDSGVWGCATEGCDNQALAYFERGGVGSHFCHACYLRVQALSALAQEGK